MNSILSIDAGRGNLHIVEGYFSKGTVFVEKAVTTRIPESCYNDDFIENKDLFIATLAETIQNAGFNSKEAVITVNAFDAIVREISLPAAKPKETASMIKNEMIQTYHAEMSDIIQFKHIGKEINEQGTALDKYRAAALDQDFVSAYHEILIGAKLKPIAMDINFNSIDKLLSGDVTVNGSILTGNATLLLDFGESLTTAYIVSEGKPVFHRHINIGSSEIERKIYEETFTPEDELRKNKEEGYNFFSHEADEKYYMILRPFFYHLIDEIRKIISYYTSRPSSASIEHIFLFGGGSSLAGFSDYCEVNFNTPTERIEIISKVKFKESATPAASYLNAIGALIRLS